MEVHKANALHFNALAMFPSFSHFKCSKSKTCPRTLATSLVPRVAPGCSR